MGIIFMLVVGAVLGWLATVVLQIETARGIVLNIGAAIAGALLTGLFIGPLFGITSLFDQNFGVVSLIVSTVGSVAFVAFANFLERRRIR